jgi:hypothetical protein
MVRALSEVKPWLVQVPSSNTFTADQFSIFNLRRRHVIDGWSPLNPRNEKGHASQFSKQPCSHGLIILVMVHHATAVKGNVLAQVPSQQARAVPFKGALLGGQRVAGSGFRGRGGSLGQGLHAGSVLSRSSVRTLPPWTRFAVTFSVTRQRAAETVKPHSSKSDISRGVFGIIEKTPH